MSTTIYGSSDDLIEIEGKHLTEEFTALREFSGGKDGGYLAFSDGTMLEIVYTDNGVWRIHPLHEGANTLVIHQAPADDENNYSDRAVIDGTLAWVVLGTAKASKRGRR